MAELQTGVQNAYAAASCKCVPFRHDQAKAARWKLTNSKEAAAARAAVLRASTKLLALFCAEQRISPDADRAGLWVDRDCTAGLATEVCKHVAIILDVV